MEAFLSTSFYCALWLFSIPAGIVALVTLFGDRPLLLFAVALAWHGLVWWAHPLRRTSGSRPG